MKYSITILSLAAAVNAHFQLVYPTSRGDNDETQATSPCGGLNTPSEVRTQWGLTGGVLKFEAGHDEADTAVYLALGNNPTQGDFNITLAPVFLQTGLGTFCWNDLEIPEGTTGVANGVNATIQVVQAGHTGGGLYNCADITFVTDPPLLTQDCANGTGVSAEAATPVAGDSTASSTGTATSSGTATGTATGTSTTTGAGAAQTSPNAASKLSGSVMFAGILAVFGFVL